MKINEAVLTAASGLGLIRRFYDATVEFSLLDIVKIADAEAPREIWRHASVCVAIVNREYVFTFDPKTLLATSEATPKDAAFKSIERDFLQQMIDDGILRRGGAIPPRSIEKIYVEVKFVAPDDRPLSEIIDEADELWFDVESEL